MKTFRDVYKFPFSVDSTGCVIDANNIFVLDIVGTSDIEWMKLFVKAINGNITYEGNIIYEDGLIKSPEGFVYARMRGGVYLRSMRCLNLSPKEAKNVHDTFGNYIVKIINRK